MKSTALKPGLLIALAGLCVVTAAYAWRRIPFTDAEAVSRAELIVVAKIKPDSIVLVPHGARSQGWEYHVELQISEVLKGQVASNTMTVAIHYGLDPVVGGVLSNKFRHFDWRSGSTNYPKEIVEIFDTGNSDLNFSPISGDLRANQIWLLHHVRPPLHNDSDMIGIVDPEDIQPLQKIDALLKLVH